MADEYADEFDSAIAGMNPDDLERRAAAGGQLPVGFYPAKLTGAKRVTSKHKETPGWELTFEITDGLYAGREVTDNLWTTDGNRDRTALFAHRLGLLQRTADGKGLVKVEGKRDLIDCLDVECIIETQLEADKTDPSKKWVRLAFTGVYRRDDPDAQYAVRHGKKPDKPGGAAAKAKAGTGTKAASESGGTDRAESGAASGTGGGGGGAAVATPTKRDVRRL